eukprot:7580313-Karenia_brevis.AAC.1
MPRATVNHKQRKTIDNGLSLADPLDPTLSEVLQAEGSCLSNRRPARPGVAICGEPVPSAEPKSQGIR